MTTKIQDINKYIDYIQDPNDSYDEYLDKAIELNVRCVFANMFQAEEALNKLRNTGIIVAGAVDFPYGKSCIEANLKDIECLSKKGIKEIDYVLNQYAIETNDFAYIEDQMSRITAFCKKNGIVDKAIVEMCKLDEFGKETICKIAHKVKPSFLKTSTGKSFGGAEIDDVALMKEILGNDIQIKAAGGIRTYEFASKLIEAGATALGSSAAIKIIEEGNA